MSHQAHTKLNKKCEYKTNGKEFTLIFLSIVISLSTFKGASLDRTMKLCPLVIGLGFKHGRVKWLICSSKLNFAIMTKEKHRGSMIDQIHKVSTSKY